MTDTNRPKVLANLIPDTWVCECPGCNLFREVLRNERDLKLFATFLNLNSNDTLANLVRAAIATTVLAALDRSENHLEHQRELADQPNPNHN